MYKRRSKSVPGGGGLKVYHCSRRAEIIGCNACFERVLRLIISGDYRSVHENGPMDRIAA